MKVTIKHTSGLYPLDVDTSRSTIDFKQAIHAVTGIPVDRMKVMMKGGILKDHANLNDLSLKEDQTITVIGTAGPIPQAPAKSPQFVEDLDERSSLRHDYEPAGLYNLGQTCYLNSTMQVLRAIPQLSGASITSASSMSLEGRVASSVKGLIGNMESASDPLLPIELLSNLRILAPQFAERDSRGQYAQQDADEAWTQIIHSLRIALAGTSDTPSIIEDLMGIQLNTIQQSIASPEEPSTSRTETVLKLQCNISVNTNFMLAGILESLDQEIEKTSPTLNTLTTYQQRSRITRLPQYLPIHLVRFYWRRDIQKKAKIMRKVKFPMQLDAYDMMADDLRASSRAIYNATKRIVAGREDRKREAAKQKKQDIATEGEELNIRKDERAELGALVANNGEDRGFIPSGLYDLCGVITHKGASADSGHYIGWTRKDDPQKPLSGEQWYKFDDDKVSAVTTDKILALDGGGEDSVAYILLYRAVSI